MEGWAAGKLQVGWTQLRWAEVLEPGLGLQLALLLERQHVRLELVPDWELVR